MLSRSSSLLRLGFKCVITRESWLDTVRFFENLADSKQIEKLDINLNVTDSITYEFYSGLTKNLSRIKTMKRFALFIDSHCQQVVDSEFFTSFGEMLSLEKLAIKATKLYTTNKQMETFFETVSKLRNLVDLDIMVNEKANFSHSYYSGLH